ncbi:hypothetical protein H8E77_41465 [bacterium]|nr:hypothetical protein [bacterium]
MVLVTLLINQAQPLSITKLTAGNPNNQRPTQISEGQNITIEMTVRNTGEARAVDVLPPDLELGLFPDGTGINLELSKLPLKQDIDVGTDVIFEWIYKTISSGDEPNYEINDIITFTGRAAGEDFNSRETKTSASKTSNEVIVQIPAMLKIEFELATFDVRPKIDGPQIFENMDFEVKMNIKNFGEATAKNVQPKPIELITLEGAGTPFLDDGPSPPNADIEGGQIQTYIWKYSTQEQKSASKSYFKTVAVGEDFNSKETIVTDGTAESDILDILMDESPSNTLSSIITVDKTKLSGGQNITVTMTIGNNREQDDVAGVVPQLIISEGEDNIKRIDDPIPSEPQFILGNKKHGYKKIEYTWQVTTEAKPGGIVKFKGIAQGKISNTDVDVKSIPGEKVIVIQTPAKLSADLKIQEEQLSVKQIFEVKMTVANKGQATAINVKPSQLTRGGNVELQSEEPVPQIHDIPGGESRDYVWNCTAIVKGNIIFTGIASGHDVNSDEKVKSPLATSNSINIVPSPSLEAELKSELYVSSDQISEGQKFSVTMMVANKENVADAINVKPTLNISKKASEQSGPIREFGPIPPVADIPSGSSQMYSWHYTTAEGDSAVVTLTGKAVGKDANTGNDVESNDNIQLTIQQLANLSILAFTVEPESTITAGQDIKVRLTVENDGEAIATSVQPSIQLLGTSKLATDAVEDGPRPPTTSDLPAVDLADGKSYTFTWVYKTQEGDEGNVQFKVSASGKDGNSQMLLQSQESFATVEIKTPADISCVLKAEPEVVSEGQDIEITMTVTNTGESTIIDVRPSDLNVEEFDEPLSSSFEGETIEQYQSKTFTWIYTPKESSAGKVTFSAYVTGEDQISSKKVKSELCKVEVTIEKPAALSSEITAHPTLISGGQEITVTMTVTNDGEATAKKVTPKLSLSGGEADAIGVQLPEGEGLQLTAQTGGEEPRIITKVPVRIEGLKTKEFSWSYSTSDDIEEKVQVFFDSTVSGRDGNSGESLEAKARQVAVTIIPLSSLGSQVLKRIRNRLPKDNIST